MSPSRRVLCAAPSCAEQAGYAVASCSWLKPFDLCYRHAAMNENTALSIVRLTPSILQAREAAEAQRMRRKAGGCADCGQPAIENESRCEKHKRARRIGIVSP